MAFDDQALQIRRAEDTDSRAVARLIEASFAHLVAPSLDVVGCVAFRMYVSERALHKRLAGGAIAWCATLSNEGIPLPVGYAELRGREGVAEHLSLLFTDLGHQRRGIAARLMRTVIRHVSTQEPEVESLTVDASAHALPIYSRWGFRSIDEDHGDGVVREGMLTRMVRELC